ncbi:ATP-dependent DNA helicase PIF1 [Hirsutella rhossiliensis]
MAIGCEHRYPGELDDLSPVEERLIALHAPFGYITKFTVDNKTRSGISYRKHVKGHIVVFPNKVDDLVTTVLPHPLLQTIENIHVSWSGSAKPGSADVRHLLQVRKSRVAAALAWLQRNNPLYENIAIDQAEMDGWRYADGSTVPTVIMDRMQREEPSTVERTQTDHIVPDTDRGLEENSFRSIDELVSSIDGTFVDESRDLDCTLSTEQTRPLLEVETICPNYGDQPFVRVERGADFADNLHEDFFPRTFPKLFPWGRGGPKSKGDSSRSRQSDAADRRPNHSLQY